MAKSDPPIPYAVEYSGLVLRHLRLLGRMAFSRGDGPEQGWNKLQLAGVGMANLPGGSEQT